MPLKPPTSSSADSLYAPSRPPPFKKQVTQYGFYDKSPQDSGSRKQTKKEKREKRRREREKEREKEREREREKEKEREKQRERERRKRKGTGPKTLDSIIVENTGSEGLDQWNKRFQKCLNILSSLPEGCPLDVRMSANSELMHLSEDFVYASHTVGKVRELFLYFMFKFDLFLFLKILISSTLLFEKKKNRLLFQRFMFPSKKRVLSLSRLEEGWEEKNMSFTTFYSSLRLILVISFVVLNPLLRRFSFFPL